MIPWDEILFFAPFLALLTIVAIILIKIKNSYSYKTRKLDQELSKNPEIMENLQKLIDKVDSDDFNNFFG